jgi:hypothetical protein
MLIRRSLGSLGCGVQRGREPTEGMPDTGAVTVRRLS